MTKLSINSSARLTFQLKGKLLAALENNSGGTSTKNKRSYHKSAGTGGTALGQCDAWSRLHTQIHTHEHVDPHADPHVMGGQRHSGKDAARSADIHMKQNEVRCLTHTICLHFRLMWSKYEQQYV